MSMDLEFPKNLPEIRLPPIQIRSPRVSNSDSNSNKQTRISRADDEEDRKIQGGENDQGCRTPTSDEHKIPKILSCPGAPRKPRRPAGSCKRKLTMELKFFEIANQEEVDAFFRSAYDLGASSSAVKRTCCRST